MRLKIPAPLSKNRRRAWQEGNPGGVENFVMKYLHVIGMRRESRRISTSLLRKFIQFGTLSNRDFAALLLLLQKQVAKMSDEFLIIIEFINVFPKFST